MEDRLIRNLGALSEADCAALRERKVLIAGCGGLGGYLAEYLLRLGVGEVAAADFDRFGPENFNRQLLCTVRTLGRLKVEAAALRAAEIAPDAAFSGHVCRLGEENLDGLLRGCDLAFDALDNAPARRALKAACDRAGVPCVFGGVSGWTAQAALSLPGDGMAELLFPEGYEAENRGVLAFTPALGAAMQAALGLRRLCGLPAETGRLYSFDLREMDFASLRL